MATDASQVVVFDGTCNLCAGAVSFVVAHERDHLIRFAPAQSAAGRKLLLEYGIDPDGLTTFVFIEEGRAQVRFDAAIAVADHLRWPWSMFRVVRFVPRRLRDSIYDLVARHRYRWFGQRDGCTLPAPELRSRLIEE
jgi:predicted DCC family thiol-disulfide oxidoreductase YuxK